MTEYAAAGHRAAERREGDSVELVHEKIRHLILSGELRAGESFSVVQLAAQCGVSRTPLREAVRMLQREGLLIGEPNRRFVVAPFSLDDLEQIYSARKRRENIRRSSAPSKLATPRPASVTWSCTCRARRTA